MMATQGDNNTVPKPETLETSQMNMKKGLHEFGTAG